MIETSIHYRKLTEIPGYVLRQPLEIIVVNDFMDEVWDIYNAMLFVPPEVLENSAGTEKYAVSGLIEKISSLCQILEQKQEEDLTMIECIQKKFLKDKGIILCSETVH